MVKKREWRNVPINPSLLQTDENNLHVEGIVNQPGQMSVVMSGDNGLFQEVIAPGVFQDAIDNSQGPIDFLLEHDEDKLLSSTVNQSLTLQELPDGVHMSANMVDTQVARDALAYINSGIIANMSFGFVVLDDSWDYDQDVPVRTVNQIVLFEVSAVRFPAYLDSNIEARKINKEDMKKYNIRSVSSNINIKGDLQLTDKEVEKKIDEISDGQSELRSLVKELSEKIEKREVEKPKDDEEKRSSEKVTPLTQESFDKGIKSLETAIRSMAKVHKEKCDDGDDTDVDTDADDEAEAKKLEAEKAKKAKKDAGDKGNESRSAVLDLDKYEDFLKED